MKYLDKNGNDFVKGISDNIVLTFNDNNHSRWEISEGGLISLYLNDSLVMSFTIDINIRNNEFLTFPFRPVPLKASLFKCTYHTQDWSIPEKRFQKKYKKQPKLVYDEDEMWEIGMKFNYPIPLGKLHFKTSIRVPLHGRTKIDVWSNQSIRINMNYINNNEIFLCDNEDSHKFSASIGSSPFELQIE